MNPTFNLTHTRKSQESRTRVFPNIVHIQTSNTGTLIYMHNYTSDLLIQNSFNLLQICACLSLLVATCKPRLYPDSCTLGRWLGLHKQTRAVPVSYLSIFHKDFSRSLSYAMFSKYSVSVRTHAYEGIYMYVHFIAGYA